MLETGIEDLGKEQRKEKKRIKTTVKKRTTEAGAPFEPLVPKMRITISAVEDVALFAIQSSEDKFLPDLDRNLSDVNTEAREVVPMGSRRYNSKHMCCLANEEKV